jgi:hypothetical protein
MMPVLAATIWIFSGSHDAAAADAAGSAGATDAAGSAGATDAAGAAAELSVVVPLELHAASRSVAAAVAATPINALFFIASPLNG